jgi:hypothetical protein
MPSKSNKEIFVLKSNISHNNKYDYTEFVYINSLTAGIIICPDHGRFLQIPKTHIKGVGCPACGIISRTKKRASTTEEYLSKLKIKRIDKGMYYGYDLVVYINNYTKIKIICPIHKIFEQHPGSHMNNANCPACSCIKVAKSITKTRETFISQAMKLHDGFYDYSKFIYINNNTKGIIICPIHGEFLQTPGNHLAGQGCSKCRYAKLAILQPKPQQQFIDEAIKLHNNLYDYSLVVYVNANTKVEIICPIHGSFWQTPHHHLHGDGCPRCSKSISKKEVKFLDYLGIKQRQVKILNKKVDGYDEETNTIYEFLGDYWHGNPDKFKANELNKTCKKTFGELYTATMDRFSRLKALGYEVKYIWETDWKEFNNKHEDIKINHY